MSVLRPHSNARSWYQLSMPLPFKGSFIKIYCWSNNYWECSIEERKIGTFLEGVVETTPFFGRSLPFRLLLSETENSLLEFNSQNSSSCFSLLPQVYLLRCSFHFHVSSRWFTLLNIILNLLRLANGASITFKSVTHSPMRSLFSTFLPLHLSLWLPFLHTWSHYRAFRV